MVYRIRVIRQTHLLKKLLLENSGTLQPCGCHRNPSYEKSGRFINLHAHIGDSHCLQAEPEYKGPFESATHLPLAKLHSTSQISTTSQVKFDDFILFLEKR